jgi:hypothetical protein
MPSPQVVFPSNAAIFGVSGTNVLVQSKSISTKIDKKDARDQDGNVIGYAYYGVMAEHSIDILGVAQADTDTVASATAPSSLGIVAAVAGGAFVIDEVTVDYSNEDFVKVSAKVSEYKIED